MKRKTKLDILCEIQEKKKETILSNNIVKNIKQAQESRKNQNEWILLSENQPSEKDIGKEFWVTYFTVDENLDEYSGLCIGVWYGSMFDLKANYFARPVAWKPFIKPEPYNFEKTDKNFIEFRNVFIKRMIEIYENDSEDSIDQLTAYHSFYDYYQRNSSYIEEVYSEYLKTNKILEKYLIPVYQIYLKNYCMET